MSVAYMHLIIETKDQPKLVGADIMSDKHPTMSRSVATVVAHEANGDGYEEARSNLFKALDNTAWRWLLDLWQKTGRR
jgi:hypothetical protein